MNRLYYGDCLTIIREHLKLSSVDLIYLDPPFNSNRAYNAIYKTETGRPLPDQIEAFCDAWTLDEQREQAIRTMPILMREAGIDHDVTEFWRLWTNALRTTNPRLLAYLSYMVERLIWMKGILKPTGSIYLHCDPTASHYIKVMMDGIFGHDSFKNEIIWSYRRWPAKSRDFQRMHDVIFRYTKGKKPTWNQLFEPLSDSALKRFGNKKQVADFSSGKRKPGQVDEDTEGAPMRDVWQIGIIAPVAKERMGYATQKPLALLERIITASSNVGDVVLDPFCGCATTLEAAHKLGRHWIGIDIAIHAIKRVAAVRLKERLGLVEDVDFEIGGIPKDIEGATLLWERDKYHFQKWAVEQAEGFVTSKRSADGGVDGRLYFEGNEPEGKGRQKLNSMILEVKGGQNVTQADLRGVRGALADDTSASMAGLIIRVPLGTRKQTNFEREMARAGKVSIRGREYSKLQLRTVEQILAGEQFDTPPVLGRQQKAQQQLVF